METVGVSGFSLEFRAARPRENKKRGKSTLPRPRRRSEVRQGDQEWEDHRHGMLGAEVILEQTKGARAWRVLYRNKVSWDISKKEEFETLKENK